MSSDSNAIISLLSQLVLSWDGAVLGVALACAAVRSVLNFTAASSALRNLRQAPAVKVSDLRSILRLDHSDKLVVVRGTVEAKSLVDGTWTTFKSGVLVSKDTNDRAVILQSTKTYIIHKWNGFIGFFNLRSIVWRYWRHWKDSEEHESDLVRKVPFVLVDGDQWPIRDMVVVNVDGSSHPVPLTIAYHHLQPVNPSPFSFLKALFGTNYPIGVLTVDKILPVGKEISAVGLCSLKNGVSEIKFCNDLPYFLSEMSKDEMVGDLASSTRMLFWTAFVLGSMSIGVLSYAVVSCASFEWFFITSNILRYSKQRGGGKALTIRNLIIYFLHRAWTMKMVFNLTFIAKERWRKVIKFPNFHPLVSGIGINGKCGGNKGSCSNQARLLTATLKLKLKKRMFQRDSCVSYV